MRETSPFTYRLYKSVVERLPKFFHSYFFFEVCYFCVTILARLTLFKASPQALHWKQTFEQGNRPPVLRELIWPLESRWADVHARWQEAISTGYGRATRHTKRSIM